MAISSKPELREPLQVDTFFISACIFTARASIPFGIGANAPIERTDFKDILGPESSTVIGRIGPGEAWRAHKVGSIMVDPILVDLSEGNAFIICTELLGMGPAELFRVLKKCGFAVCGSASPTIRFQWFRGTFTTMNFLKSQKTLTAK